MTTTVETKIQGTSKSNYIFILDLTPGFNGLGKNNGRMRGESFKFLWFGASYIRDFMVCQHEKCLKWTSWGQCSINHSNAHGCQQTVKICTYFFTVMSHRHHSIWSHQQLDCLLKNNCWGWRRRKTSKFHFTDPLCWSVVPLTKGH